MKAFVNFCLTLVALFLIPVPETIDKSILGILYPCIALFVVLVPKPKNQLKATKAGIDVEVWKKYIIERLLKDNAFLTKCKDDSGYVLGGAVVHIPQAGAKPVVVKNRNAYPATAVRRTDTDVTYSLDTYSTDPHHIPWADLQTISYDKLDSILGDHVATLGEVIADDMLIKWSPAAANFIRTTGTAIGPISGQTGNRKGLEPVDLITGMIKMNLAKVQKAGRIAMIDDNMYGYFYDKLTEKEYNAFNQFADNKNGIVGRLHGFDIMTRTSVLAYASNDVVKALDTATAAGDNLASLLWHPSTVCKAVGEMKPFQEIGSPLYYGDLYSMIVRMGGRKERADNVGVYAIVQDAAA